MTVRVADTRAARQACFDIRRAVFIEEQQIPEAEEWDAADAACVHYLCEGGTARMIARGDTAKIGRVAVMPAFRGTGLGARIMVAVMTDARMRGFRQAEVESQTYAERFYAKLGFLAEGPEYDDGSGIMHRLMRAEL